MPLTERQTIKNFVKSRCRIERPTAVTLTCKQQADGERLDGTSLSRNVTHFLNRLDCQVLGSKCKRFNKNVGAFTVVEGDDATRLHVHLIMDRPSKKTLSEFEKIIRECWEKTKFGYSRNKKYAVVVTDGADDGWLDYLLKKRTKQESIFDASDWVNIRQSSME